MDNKFIEQMRAELYDTRLCRSDFEKYDVEALKENTEPFFWLVRECGTSLLKIGASEITRWFSNEWGRFDMFRHPDYHFSCISCYSNYEDLKVFYWDGLDLRRITMQDAANIYNNLVTPMWEQKIQQYPKEYEMRSKPLEIRFMSEETEKRYQADLLYAQGLDDTSLQDCVNRLSHWCRKAVDHYISISSDFTEHGYCFCEMVNGEPRINGGIIMSQYAEKNRWSTHT